MRPFRSIWQRIRPLFAVATCWLALQATALAEAADGSGEESSGAGPWVAPYAVLMLGIVLGLLGVCLSSRRKDREKPETYASKTTLNKGK